MNREQWLEARLDGIGASESAAILGYDPFASPWSVWQKKVDRVIGDQDAGPMAEWGHRLEPVISTAFEEKAQLDIDDWEIADPGEYAIIRNKEVPWMFCTPDRLITDGSVITAPLEIKCAYFDRARQFEDELPIHYRIQLTHQMICLGVSEGYYAALLNGYDFRWFREELSEKFAASLVKRLGDFWELVQNKTAPATDWRDGTKRAIAAHHDPNGDAIELPERFAIVDGERETLKAQRAIIDRKLKAYDNEIRAALGDATVGVLPNRKAALTWAPRKDGTRVLGRRKWEEYENET